MGDLLILGAINTSVHGFCFFRLFLTVGKGLNGQLQLLARAAPTLGLHLLHHL